MVPKPGDAATTLLGLTRSGLYVALFAGWGISLAQRIIHPQVMRLLEIVDALMIFWLVVRTLRFQLEVTPWLSRLLWYFYYLPMLGLTTLCVMIALILEQSEVYRLPRRAYLLWVPALSLLALVLTNDLHQCVFRLSDPWTDHYTYSYGYALIVLWIVACAAATFGIVVYKCRAPHIRRRCGNACCNSSLRPRPTSPCASWKRRCSCSTATTPPRRPSAKTAGPPGRCLFHFAAYWYSSFVLQCLHSRARCRPTALNTTAVTDTVTPMMPRISPVRRNAEPRTLFFIAVASLGRCALGPPRFSF